MDSGTPRLQQNQITFLIAEKAAYAIATGTLYEPRLYRSDGIQPVDQAAKTTADAAANQADIVAGTDAGAGRA